MASFLCYYTLILDPGALQTFGELRGRRQKSQICTILASFLCYYSFILVHGANRIFYELRGPFTGTSSKLADLVHFAKFTMLLLTDFGSRATPNIRGTSGTRYGDKVKTRRIGPVWPVFYAITR